jgi:uncharacterized protein YlxW (UPF0749 family)
MGRPSDKRRQVREPDPVHADDSAPLVGADAAELTVPGAAPDPAEATGGTAGTDPPAIDAVPVTAGPAPAAESVDARAAAAESVDARAAAADSVDARAAAADVGAAPADTANPTPAAVAPAGPTGTGTGATEAGATEAGAGVEAGGADAAEVAGPPATPAGRRRASAAGAVIGLLLGLLGFTLVAQLRSASPDTQLEAARPEDLVRILSDLDARQDRLRQDINTLEASRRQLASGAQGREAALAEARRRADALGILAGTLPAQGPGLEIQLKPGAEGLRAATLLDAVEELRGAGGEAMQIAGANGAAVRIVAATPFVDATGGVLVDGTLLTGSLTLVVVGDPPTMQTALNIPRGVVDSVKEGGGTVAVQQRSVVHVTTLRPATVQRYARPVS